MMMMKLNADLQVTKQSHLETLKSDFLKQFQQMKIISLNYNRFHNFYNCFVTILRLAHYGQVKYNT